MDRQKFLEERRTGIGGSDAAKACGVSHYGSRLDVYLQKLGLLPEIEQTAKMALGRAMEPVIREWYRKTGFSVLAPGDRMRRHSKHNFMIYHPDGYIDANGNGRGIFEAKLTTSRMLLRDGWNNPPDNVLDVTKFFGTPGTDQVPIDYLFQGHHGLIVYEGEREWIDIVACFADMQEPFQVYHIDPDSETWQMMIEREGELWDRIQRNDPPEAELNKNGEDALRLLHPADTVAEIAPTPEIATAVLGLLEVKEELKRLETEKQTYQTQIINHMGEAGLMQGDDWKISYKKSKDSQKVDWQSVARKLGATDDVIAEFTELLAGSRRFLPRRVK